MTDRLTMTSDRGGVAFTFDLDIGSMLTLPIKKRWFNMILSGEKKEEYREIKPYYMTRFSKAFGFINCATFVADKEKFIKQLRNIGVGGSIFVRFRNGYSKNSPSFIAKCTRSIGNGKDEWGAEPGKEYFVLTVKKILNT